MNTEQKDSVPAAAGAGATSHTVFLFNSVNCCSLQQRFWCQFRSWLWAPDWELINRFYPPTFTARARWPSDRRTLGATPIITAPWKGSSTNERASDCVDEEALSIYEPTTMTTTRTQTFNKRHRQLLHNAPLKKSDARIILPKKVFTMARLTKL